MTAQAIAVRRRLIQSAAPHLIDRALVLMGLSTVPAAIGRGVVAEALALCGDDPDHVAALRWQWLTEGTAESWLHYVRRHRP